LLKHFAVTFHPNAELLAVEQHSQTLEFPLALMVKHWYRLVMTKGSFGGIYILTTWLLVIA